MEGVGEGKEGEKLVLLRGVVKDLKLKVVGAGELTAHARVPGVDEKGEKKKKK